MENYPKILGVGNPVCDITAEVDIAFLEAHHLIPGSACLYDPTKHGDIYSRLKQVGGSATKYSAGGATQNAIRVAQAFCGTPGFTAYIGCVGDDEDARLMQSLIEAQGVKVVYEVHRSLPTAKCAVALDLATKERTMCTQLDAANNLSSSFVDSHWDIVKGATIHFSAGFVVTNQPDGMIKIAETCAADSAKLWGTCFCADFIIKFFTDKVRQWIDLANFITGNEVEWAVFAETMGYPKELPLREVVQRACETPGWRCRGDKPRIMVCTQGAKPTIVAYRSPGSNEVRVEQYSVVSVPRESIVDCTGCGDSFVGGMLFGLAEGYPLEKCIHLGHIAGAYCVQHHGLDFDFSVLPKFVTTVPKTM